MTIRRQHQQSSSTSTAPRPAEPTDPLAAILQRAVRHARRRGDRDTARWLKALLRSEAAGESGRKPEGGAP
jgi:hypothetical protein